MFLMVLILDHDTCQYYIKFFSIFFKNIVSAEYGPDTLNLFLDILQMVL